MRKFSFVRRKSAVFKTSGEQTCGTFPFERLPLDIMKEIFSYIPFVKLNWFNFAIACKPFAVIAKKLFDPSVYEQKALRYAVLHGKANSVKILLEDPRVNPGVYSQQCIITASTNGNVEIVKLLIQHPLVDPSADEHKAIRRAIQLGHCEIVELLLDRVKLSIDLLEYHNFVLICADCGHSTVFDSILKNAPKDIVPPLLSAAFQASVCVNNPPLLYKIIQEYNYDPSSDDNWAYKYIVNHKHKNNNLLKFLLEDKRVREKKHAAKHQQKNGE